MAPPALGGIKCGVLPVLSNRKSPGFFRMFFNASSFISLENTGWEEDARIDGLFILGALGGSGGGISPDSMED